MNKLFIIAAPSGAGKTSLVRALLAKLPNLKVAVSYTTRPPRPNDRDGEDYCFVSVEEFERMRKAGEFLEWAKVYGNYYGTSKTWVLEQFAANHSVVLEIDWQGCFQIKKLYPDAISIYILPPSIKALRERLLARKQDSHAEIEKRLAKAQEDIAHAGEFDYTVVNEDFEVAVARLTALMSAAEQGEVSQRVDWQLIDQLTSPKLTD